MAIRENNKTSGRDDVLEEKLHPHTHHIVTPGFVDIPRRSDCTSGQMDGEAGWWTTCGNIELPLLARVMGMGRQQQQLKNIGPKAQRCLLTILNKCFMENKIPTLWIQSKIIAILKPGKDSAIPKSYNIYIIYGIIISLLCHTYKVYERMILNRIAPTIKQHLIKEHAGFRPGKSCTRQLLNLTQHIEDGYQKRMITGTAFVDMSAAYDTVNHIL